MKNTFFEEQNLPTLAERDLACDFAVVGGGLAGLCAAVAAARNGLHTVLLQDRPVLGGNASSEIRMGIGGHTGTGLLEELLLENLYRNPGLRFTVWDDVMYGFARREPNLTVLLNTPVISVKTEANRIVSVTGFHLQEYARIEVTAHCFADCSGDGILRLSGAGNPGRSSASRTRGKCTIPARWAIPSFFSSASAPATCRSGLRSGLIIIPIKRFRRVRWSWNGTISGGSNWEERRIPFGTRTRSGMSCTRSLTGSGST